ncbi:MAG: hypothetical protein P8L32_04615, partial [Paracoccaceae bacterium]|nr:hypothetical protein [Paracoccaceae bacterium]
IAESMLRVLFLLLIFPIQLSAQDSQTSRLLELMRFEALASVIHQEGMVNNASLLEDFGFPAGGAAWQTKLENTFDPEHIQASMEAGFLDAFNLRSIDDILVFLASDEWIKVFDLQNAASIAMLDPEVENASFDTYWSHVESQSHRLSLIEELVDDSDLITLYVAAAMNGILSFNDGISSISPEIAYPEDEMLALAYEEKDALELEILEWVFAYFLLTYDPVETSVLEDQIEFWKSRSGKDLSNAMMNAYDAAHKEIAFKLGKAFAETLSEPTL